MCRIRAHSGCTHRHHTRRTSANTHRIPTCRTSDTGGPHLAMDWRSSNPGFRIPTGYGVSPRHAYPAQPPRDVKARSRPFHTRPQTSPTTSRAHPIANDPSGRRYPLDHPPFSQILRIHDVLLVRGKRFDAEPMRPVHRRDSCWGFWYSSVWHPSARPRRPIPQACSCKCRAPI